MSIISNIKNAAKKIISVVSTAKNIAKVATATKAAATNIVKKETANTISNAYTSVDKAIGGALPGGYAAPEKTTQPVKPAQPASGVKHTQGGEQQIDLTGTGVSFKEPTMDKQLGTDKGWTPNTPLNAETMTQLGLTGAGSLGSGILKTGIQTAETLGQKANYAKSNAKSVADFLTKRHSMYDYANSAGNVGGQINSKTSGLINAGTLKTLGGIAFAGWFIHETLGSESFGTFAKNDAAKSLSFTVTNSLKAGDIDSARLAAEEIDKLTSPEGRTGILGWLDKIPQWGAITDNEAALKALAKKNEIDKHLIDLTDEQKNNNMTDAQMWEKINAENDRRELALEEAKIDLYNKSQEKNRKANEAAAHHKNKDYQRMMEELNTSKLEQQRIANEEWLATMKAWLKMKQQAYENSAPSRLGFGLI